MPSPFPGMDPYLERYWRDVHGAIVTYARGEINRQLHGPLRAQMDERLVVECLDEPVRFINPDVHISDHQSDGEGKDTLACEGGTAVAEATQPLVIDLSQRATERTIDIVDTSQGDRVITSIEFVSPTNKMVGDGRNKYLQKQKECLDAQVNLVEIDLTRNGGRELSYPQADLPRRYQTAYLTVVRRFTRGDRYEIYPMSLFERLPTIRIPLRAEDDDVTLNIQGLVDRAYDEGRYDQTDYSNACVPPLEGDEGKWAAGIVQSA